MRAIIAAAGMGTRLRPHTELVPKCMLPVRGRPILDWVLEALNKAGIESVAVVRGHGKDFLKRPGLEYYENCRFAKTNMLYSLFCAELAMEEGFVFSYSDILYGTTLVKKLLEGPGEVKVICDRAWLARYEGRMAHPLEEAELIHAPGGEVLRIGKAVVGRDEARGEFIGLAHFTSEGARQFRELYHELDARFDGRPGQPFQEAKSFKKAYMTDIFQEMADRGFSVKTVDVESGWIEVDTEEDLAFADANWP